MHLNSFLFPPAEQLALEGEALLPELMASLTLAKDKVNESCPLPVLRHTILEKDLGVS